MPQSGELSTERRGDADWVTLNRPHRMNAIDGALLHRLHGYFRQCGEDDALRVIILRGAGRCFCSGVDAKDYADPSTPSFPSWKLGDTVRMIHEGPQPVIVLLNGPALGAGFSLAAAADVRIATPHAWMQASFTKLGLGGAELGLSYFLPAGLGLSVAREICMTGRRLMPDRALATGFLSELVAQEELDAAGRRMAADMLALSVKGLRTTKETMNPVRHDGRLEAAIAIERRGQLLCAEGGIVDQFSALAERLDANTGTVGKSTNRASGVQDG